MSSVPSPRHPEARRRALRLLLAATLALGAGAASLGRPAPAAATCAAFQTCVTLKFDLSGPGQGGASTNQWAGCSVPGATNTSCSERVPTGTDLTIDMRVHLWSCGSGWQFSQTCDSLYTDQVVTAPLHITADTDIQLAFPYWNQAVVTVSKSGSGSGTVTSADYPNIDCGTTCAGNLPSVKQRFTATPAKGSVFVSWSGGCSGTDVSCLTVVADGMTISARFDLAAVATATPKPTSTPGHTVGPTATPTTPAATGSSAPPATAQPSSSTEASSPGASASEVGPSPSNEGAATPAATAGDSGPSGTTSSGSSGLILVIGLVVVVVALRGAVLLRRRGRPSAG